MIMIFRQSFLTNSVLKNLPTVAIKKTRHLVNLPYKPGISN